MHENNACFISCHTQAAIRAHQNLLTDYTKINTFISQYFQVVKTQSSWSPQLWLQTSQNTDSKVPFNIQIIYYSRNYISSVFLGDTYEGSIFPQSFCNVHHSMCVTFTFKLAFTLCSSSTLEAENPRNLLKFSMVVLGKYKHIPSLSLCFPERHD